MNDAASAPISQSNLAASVNNNNNTNVGDNNNNSNNPNNNNNNATGASVNNNNNNNGQQPPQIQHVRKTDYLKFQKLGDDSVVDLSRTKKYYWVIDSKRRLIAYYKNDLALKPKCVIDPMNVLSVRATQSGQGRIFFILLERRGSAKMIQIRFKTRADRDDWLSAIRTVLQVAATDHRVHDVVHSVRKHLSKSSNELGFHITSDLNDLAHQEGLFPLFIDAIDAGAHLLKKVVTTLSGRGMSLPLLIKRAIIHVNFVFIPSDGDATDGKKNNNNKKDGNNNDNNDSDDDDHNNNNNRRSSSGKNNHSTPSYANSFQGTCYDPSAKQLEIGVDLVFANTDAVNYLAMSNSPSMAASFALLASNYGFGADGNNMSMTYNSNNTQNFFQYFPSSISNSSEQNNNGSPTLNHSAGDNNGPKQYTIRTINVSHAISMLSSTLWRNPQFEQWLFLDGESSQAGAEITKALKEKEEQDRLKEEMMDVNDENDLMMNNNKKDQEDFRFSLQWSHTLHESSDAEQVERYVRDFVNADLLSSITEMIRQILSEDEEQIQRSGGGLAGTSLDMYASALFGANGKELSLNEGTMRSTISYADSSNNITNSNNGQEQQQQQEDPNAPKLKLLSASSCIRRYISGVGIQIDGVSVEQQVPPQLSLVLANWEEPQVTAAVAMSSRLRRALPAGGGSSSHNLAGARRTGSQFGIFHSSSLGNAVSGSFDRAASTQLSAITILKDRVIDIITHARIAHVCKQAEVHLGNVLSLHDPVSVEWESLSDALLQNFQNGSSNSSPSPQNNNNNNNNGTPAGASSGLMVKSDSRGLIFNRLNSNNNASFGGNNNNIRQSPAGANNNNNNNTRSTSNPNVTENYTMVNELDLLPLIQSCCKVLSSRYRDFVSFAGASHKLENFKRIIRRVAIRFRNSTRENSNNNSSSSSLTPTVDRGVMHDTLYLVLDKEFSPIEYPPAAAITTITREDLFPTATFIDPPLFSLLPQFSVAGGFSVSNLLVWFECFSDVASNNVPFPEDDVILNSSADNNPNGHSSLTLTSGGIVRGDGKPRGVNNPNGRKFGNSDDPDSEEDEEEEDVGEMVAIGRMVETKILTMIDAVNTVYDQQGIDPQFKVSAAEIQLSARQLNAAFPGQKVTNHDLSRVLNITLKKARILYANLLKYRERQQKYRQNFGEITNNSSSNNDSKQQHQQPSSSSKPPQQEDKEIELLQQYCEFKDTKNAVPELIKATRVSRYEAKSNNNVNNNGAAAASSSSSSPTLSTGSPAAGSPSHQRDLNFQEFAGLILHRLMPLEAALSVRSRRNILFAGLTQTGKSLLIDCMKQDFANSSVLKPTEPTIGLTTTLVPFANWVLSCKELGGREQQTSYVKEFEPMLSDLNGIVFVVDATRRDVINDVKVYLSTLLGLSKLKGLPCLLLINNGLAPKAMATNTLCERIGWAKACSSGNHDEHVEQRCCVVTSGQQNHRRGIFNGDGARDGILWLCNAM